MKNSLYVPLLYWFLQPAWAECAKPQDITDGWSTKTSAAAGFDEAALCAALANDVLADLHIDSIVIERKHQLVAKLYRTGQDKSVYSLLSTDLHSPQRDAITLKNLLTMGAGLQFNCNGGNSLVLADVITRSTRMPLNDFAKKNLFDPWGITDWE